MFLKKLNLLLLKIIFLLKTKLRGCDENQSMLFEAVSRNNMIIASVLFSAHETIPVTALNISDKTATHQRVMEE